MVTTDRLAVLCPRWDSVTGKQAAARELERAGRALPKVIATR